MKNLILLAQITMIIIFTSYSYDARSIDIVKIKKQQLSMNKAAHNNELFKRALEITEDEFGPFELENVDVIMTSNRELRAVENGIIINATITPANEQWDKQLISIQTPIRLGLLSYRLLLVNKIDLPKFKNVNTLDDLKQLTAGLLHDWKTTAIFKAHNFKMVESHNFEGLFLMLNKHRFDYIPRAIYEVNDELNAQKSILNNIVVEPTIALFIPTITYIYVSPKTPRLAKRLDTGLKKLFNNGELKKILEKYYAVDIDRAKLNQRKIIKIESSYYLRNGEKYNGFYFNED